MQVVRQLRRAAYNVTKQLLCVTLQRLQFVILFARHIGQCFHLRLEIRAKADQVQNLNTLNAFEKNDHVAVRHFHGFMNFCERSNFVKVGRSRIFDSRIELRDHAQILFLVRQRIDQRQRAFAPNGERKDRARKQDGVPNGKDGQSVWHEIAFISHGVLSAA